MSNPYSKAVIVRPIELEFHLDKNTHTVAYSEQALRLVESSKNEDGMFGIHNFKTIIAADFETAKDLLILSVRFKLKPFTGEINFEDFSVLIKSEEVYDGEFWPIPWTHKGWFKLQP